MTFAIIIKVQSFFDVIRPRISQPSKRQVQLQKVRGRDVNVSETSLLILQTINVIFGNIFCVIILALTFNEEIHKVNKPEYRSRYSE